MWPGYDLTHFCHPERSEGSALIIASQLRPGTFLKIGGDLFKVIDSTFHVGQGKMPGSVHAKLQDVRKATFKELRWRPEERLEEVQLQKQEMEFLYSDEDSATFMNPVSFCSWSRAKAAPFTSSIASAWASFTRAAIARFCRACS
jgi:translation elongation factor P/translation initiation factor 5A